MAAPTPWTPMAPPPLPNDPNSILLRIEKNTQNLILWVRILVVVVIVLALVAVFVG